MVNEVQFPLKDQILRSEYPRQPEEIGNSSPCSYAKDTAEKKTVELKEIFEGLLGDTYVGLNIKEYNWDNAGIKDSESNIDARHKK